MRSGQSAHTGDEAKISVEDYVFDSAPVGVLVVDRDTLSGTVGKTRIHLAR